MSFNKLILLSLFSVFASSVYAMDPIKFAKTRVQEDKLALLAGVVTTLATYKIASMDIIKAKFAERVKVRNPEFIQWLCDYHTAATNNIFSGSCPEEFLNRTSILKIYTALKVVTSLIAGYKAYKAVKYLDNCLLESINKAIDQETKDHAAKKTQDLSQLLTEKEFVG